MIEAIIRRDYSRSFSRKRTSFGRFSGRELASGNFHSISWTCDGTLVRGEKPAKDQAK